MRQRVCRPQRSQVFGASRGSTSARPARKSLASCSMRSRQPGSCSGANLFLTRVLLPLRPAKRVAAGSPTWPAKARSPARTLGQPVLDQGAAAFEAGKESGRGIADVAGKGQIAGAYLGKN